MSREETLSIVASMEEHAEVAPELALTPENWAEIFGENNSITTPVGQVKMGDNQITKFFAKGREKSFGMVAPTLSNPDVIIEKDAQSPNAERNTKYLFLKTFIKSDGSRYVHFETVTVRKDGMEVSISSHEIDRKVARKEMQNGIILHLNNKLSLDSERYLIETQNDGRPDLVPTSDNNISKSQGNVFAPITEDTNVPQFNSPTYKYSKKNPIIRERREKNAQEEGSAEQQLYPVDEKGEPLWYDMTDEQFDVAMAELGDTADAFVADKIKEARKATEKAEKAKPKSTEFAKRKAEQQAITAEKATAQRAYDYWTAQQARRAENAQSENLEETNKKPTLTEKETSYERRNGLPQAEIEVSLSEQEASVFMEVMGVNADEQPIIELNPSNWVQQFGADGKVSTPLGEVKMGNNQIAKLFEKGRNEQFGMIKPTLETPLAVIEVPSEATEQETERASSLLFVKTFLGKNGEKVYYFKSVTVKKDGMEVSVSSHYDRPKRIKEALKNGKLLYRFDGGAQTEHRPADTSVAASRNDEQGLSGSKDSDIPSKKQNPGGNGLSPDDAGNRGADTGGRGTEQGTERVTTTADTAQTAAAGQTTETPAESSNLSIHESQQKQTGIPYRLSNELDENGCPFVLASDGTTIFGEINEETGLIPAPIKLSEGTKDYGLLHIESRHGQQIKQSGFKGVIEFVENVAQNYTDIKEGKVRNSNKTYIIEVSDKYNNTLFVELSQDGSYWNVNSAGVFRKKYSNKKETVVKTEPQQPNNAISAGSSLSENEERGITSSEPNGEPPVSNSKYSKESSNVQEPLRHRTGEEAGSRDIIDMTEEELAEIRAKEREKIDRIFGKEYLDNVAEAVEKRKAERKAVVSKAARELRSELTASPDIVLVSDLKDIPEEELQGKTPQEAIRRMRAKGWYTPGNGKVYINLSMHSTAEDVKATILHEAVAHKGLRALLGEESFGALCDAVYRSMPKKRQKAYEDTYKKIYPNTAEAELRRIIADEYMARLAEGGAEQSIPQRIISAIREFLRSVGIDLEINDADIRYLLAQSYKNMQEADAVKVLDNSALLARLRKAAEETHIKSEAESLYRLGDNNKTFSERVNRAVENKGTATETQQLATEAVLKLLSDVGIEVSTNAEEFRDILEANVRLQEMKKSAKETESALQEEHQPSVVSIADNTNILNNLQKLFEKYVKNSNVRPNVFIGDVAKALSMPPTGRTSQYGTYETKNGKIITIRISGHNSKVSNYDNAGVRDGISIVITPKKNKGLINNGDAHIVEVYYDAIKLRKLDGKPLASIIKSIEQSLYSGKYKDTTGIAKVEEVNALTPIEKDLKTVGHVQFLQTPNGDIYGFVKDGVIYLNGALLNTEAPIHEYTHLWDTALQEINPTLWATGVKLMQQTPVWAEIKNNPAYADIADNDDLLASEVHARLVGKHGAAIFNQIADEAKKTGKTDVGSVISKLRDWVNNVWDWVKSILGNPTNITTAEFVNMPIKDLVNATRFRFTPEERQAGVSAQADGTWMKAPNGKPTNLTERQWVQVRTKAFKEWFGDWEKAARIEKLRASKPVEITGDEYKGKYEMERESAKQWMKANLRGEYVIADTGERIEVSGTGVDKVTSHSMGNEAHLKSLAVMPQLIENAIFIDELPNEKGNGKYDSYRYYVCGLKIGGVDYTVKVTIGVKQGKRYYDHSLTEIEKGNLIEIANGFTTTGGAPVPSSAEYKDRRLVSILQTNSSKVVDENGEPMVVYHGTNESFLSFDRNKAGISRNTCERQGRIGRNIWQKFFPERIRDSQKADGGKNGRINNLENKKSYSHRRKSYKNDAYFGFEQNFQHQR